MKTFIRERIRSDAVRPTKRGSLDKRDARPTFVAVIRAVLILLPLAQNPISQPADRWQYGKCRDGNDEVGHF
jgi:hypothetical protein